MVSNAELTSVCKVEQCRKDDIMDDFKLFLITEAVLLIT